MSEERADALAEQQRQRPVQQQPTYDVGSGRWSDGWGEPGAQSEVDPRIDAFEAGWSAGYNRGVTDADVGSGDSPEYDEALAAFLAERAVMVRTATVRSIGIYEVMMVDHPEREGCTVLTKDQPVCRGCGAGLVALHWSDGKIEPL